MSVRVCGAPVGDGARVTLNPQDPLWVEGGDLTAVVAGERPLVRIEDRFVPDGPLDHRLRMGGGSVPLELHLRRPRRRWTITVELTPTRLPAEEVQALRDALGELAASFENPRVYADVEVAIQGAGATGSRLATDPDASLRALYDALRRHLPPLLDRPLRVQRIEPGPTPAARAQPTPGNLIARTLRGERAQVLAPRRVEGGSPADYGWLARLVGDLQAYAGRQLRNRGRLAFDGADERVTWWHAAHNDCQHWRAHRELAGRAPASQPTWILSRDVHGAAIVRAATHPQVGLRLAGGDSGSAARRLARLQVAQETHLYELWVVLSVVEVLRQNFGFAFAAGEPQRLHDYAEVQDGRFRFRPMSLIRRCAGPDGAPVGLRATVEHAPAMVPGDGGPPLTPDLALTVEPLDGGDRTVHLLDAKYSRRSPLEQARGVALGKYLARLPVTASFVALPTPKAALDRLMGQLDGRYHRRYPEHMEARDRAAYGVAWGSIHAAPLSGQLGIRQFVTLALQYHRTELRHVCGQCGHGVSLDDMRLVHGGGAQRKLAAHRDGPLGDQPVSPDLLEYHCPRCDYRWSRHRCYRGHVLMKHGRLTPHHQIDGDHNVACSACGHRKGQGPAME